MNNDKLTTRIEYILSYLLSRKHGKSIKISFKKENDLNGNNNQTRTIEKE